MMMRLGVILAHRLSVYETPTHAAHAYFYSAIMLLFFLRCGRYLDQMVRRKTRMFGGCPFAYLAFSFSSASALP
jgi:Cu2+-exporting ATPase